VNKTAKTVAEANHVHAVVVLSRLAQPAEGRVQAWAVAAAGEDTDVLCGRETVSPG
jgi:hypothetical protein